MYSFGVSGWYGVGMSNWSVYKRVGICYWGMSVSMSIRKSSIGYYWCLYFDWFWSLNLDGLYGWEGIGQSWEGVVSIYRWSERSCWESRLKKLWFGCWGGRSYGGNGQNDKC